MKISPVIRDYAVAALPLVCGVSAALLLIFLHSISGLNPRPFPNIIWHTREEFVSSAELTARDVQSRISWGVSTAGLWSSAVAAVGVAVWAMAITTTPRERKWIPVFALALLLLLSGIGYALDSFGMFFGRDLSSTLHDGILLRDGRDIGFVTTVGNTLVFIGSVMLALSFVVVLRPRSDESLSSYRRRFDALRVILYTSAAILVMGTIEVFYLYDWPSALAVCEVQAVAIHKMARSMSAGAGTAGSILLAALYAPTAMLMSERSRGIAAAASPESSRAEQDKWLMDEGLRTDTRKRVQDILAIVSPLIAGGGIAQLLNNAS